MPTLLYRQEPHQRELLRIEVATAAVPSARRTYYDHLWPYAIRCQLTNESVGVLRNQPSLSTLLAAMIHHDFESIANGRIQNREISVPSIAFQPRTKSPTALILAYRTCLFCRQLQPSPAAPAPQRWGSKLILFFSAFFLLPAISTLDPPREYDSWGFCMGSQLWDNQGNAPQRIQP